MTFYFEEFPQIRYDLKKNGKVEFLTDITLRFKIVEKFKQGNSGYYNYSILDGERPDEVAFKAYKDPKLSWTILLVNNIFDVNYDWPLGYNDLIRFIKKKYGSVPQAQAQVHEYRKIIRPSQVLFDGTIISKKTLVIDETTFNTLDESSKETISKFQYEQEKNEAKRNIKLIPPDKIQRVLSEVRDILNG